MPDRDDDLRDWKADVYAAWTQDKEATRRVLSRYFAERDEMDGYLPEHHGASRIASVSRWMLPFLAGDCDIIHFGWYRHCLMQTTRTPSTWTTSA
jgi:hypothetical protein